MVNYSVVSVSVAISEAWEVTRLILTCEGIIKFPPFWSSSLTYHPTPSSEFWQSQLKPKCRVFPDPVLQITCSVCEFSCSGCFPVCFHMLVSVSALTLKVLAYNLSL